MTHLGQFVVLALASVLPRPPSGVDIDETRTVIASREVPAACFAYVSASGSLLVQGRRIVKAASSPLRTWRTETERVAFVHASRARELISASQPGAGPHGCRVIGPSVSMNALTLLVEEAEAGRAMAERPDGVFAPALAIRYHGKSCGPLRGIGIISVSLPSGTGPLLEVIWWQA